MWACWTVRHQSRLTWVPGRVMRPNERPGVWEVVVQVNGGQVWVRRDTLELLPRPSQD